MIKPKWYLADQDTGFFEIELDDFVPDRIYDAHVHLGPRSGFSGELHSDLVANTPEIADMASYREHLHWILPNRDVTGANILPSTLNGNRWQEGNAFAAKEATADDVSGSSVIVHPEMTADRLREEIATYNPVSLKPYHLMSPRRPTMQSTIEEYLPEHLVAVANDAQLPIVLHLVLNTALADERNQGTIRHYCETYPGMTLVLAHCARCFNPAHMARGIGGIAGLENV